MNHIKNIDAEKVIIGKRTVHHDYLDKLLSIPEGSSVLVVNDEYNVTMELIQSLYQLGISHVRFLPFKKNQTYHEKIDAAVSPGEIELVPLTYRLFSTLVCVCLT